MSKKNIIDNNIKDSDDLSKKRLAKKLELIKEINADFQKCIEYNNEIATWLSEEDESEESLERAKSRIENRFIGILGKTNELFLTVGSGKNRDLGLDIGLSDIEFSCHKDEWRIVFPTLIERKTRNYNYVKAMYEPPFDEYFAATEYSVYDEKVVICFVHYFRPEDRKVDMDNFYVKPVIDLIQRYLLIDDGPEYVSTYSDDRIGEKAHSEVIVMPISQFMDWFAKNSLG